MIQGDSRILVQGCGYKPVKEFEGLQEIWNGNSYTDFKICPKIVQDTATIKFRTGNEITCDANATIQIYRHGKLDTVKVKNLKPNSRVVALKNTPEFDFIRSEVLSSYELGILTAFSMSLRKENELIVHEAMYDLRDVIETLFAKLAVKYESKKQYKSTTVNVLYEFESNIKALTSEYATKDGLTEKAWASKTFFHGFLRIYMGYTDKGGDSLLKGVTKNLGKDLQKVLQLFGVGSTLSGGLITSRISISKHDLYRFALNVSLLKEKHLMSKMTRESFKKYSAISTQPLTFRVTDVIINTQEMEMYDIGKNFMSDGVIFRG